MTTFQSFGSFDEMMDAIDASRKAADVNVRPWQAAIKPGDHYVLLEPQLGLTIYGEVLDPARPNPDEEPDPEVVEEARIYQEPHMLGFRLARAYSQACPEGEMGDVHVSAIWRLIEKEQFESAKVVGWPDLLPLAAQLEEARITLQEDGKIRLDFKLGPR